MAKTRRVLRLVHLLSDTGDGLTLDEIADELEVNRRTGERLREVVDGAFGQEIIQDDRRKRFRIPVACAAPLSAPTPPRWSRSRPKWPHLVPVDRRRRSCSKACSAR